MRTVISGKEEIIKSIPVSDGLVEIGIKAKEQKCQIYIVDENGQLPVKEDVDLIPYTTEEAGGFVGCTVGMYTSSNGADSDNRCSFKWISHTKN